MTQQSIIFHIAQHADLDQIKPAFLASANSDLSSRAAYSCNSLSVEGFIHCCDKHQLAGVVSRYYREVDEVDLLILDVDKLEAPLIRENTMGGSELFPHLYGEINVDAIVNIIDFGIHSDERKGLEL